VRSTGWRGQPPAASDATRGQRTGVRRARKKSCSKARLSAPRTPAWTAIRWFRRGSPARSTTEPAAPPLGSGHP